MASPEGPPPPAPLLTSINRRFGNELGLTPRVEYVKQRKEYGIRFIFSLFCGYINLEYGRIHVINRANWAERVICIRVAVLQKYVNTFSTCRGLTLCVDINLYQCRGQP